MALDNLPLEATHCHFCCSLRFQASHQPTQFQGRGHRPHLSTGRASRAHCGNTCGTGNITGPAWKCLRHSRIPWKQPWRGIWGRVVGCCRRAVVSNSLRPHGLQHSRLPCPSPSPRVCSNSCPLSQMSSNHLILCRSFLLLPSILPSIRLFSKSQLVTSGDESIRASASASVLPMNIQG